LLVAQNLAKSYSGRPVVQNFSIQLPKASVVGLLGPNGAGKTTCFYMIVGLVRADEGRITVNNQEVTGLPMHERARLGIGYLPQERSVFSRLSVEDNIMAVLELRRDLQRGQAHKELERLLAELQIDHRRKQMGNSLSGGERRRVEMARALAGNPQFMLLDEPFAAVDPISTVDMQRIIKHLKARGIGVLITDHKVRETLGICDHAYIMHAGTLLTHGSPAAVLADARVREVYLGEEFKL
jgi:lipopolysaccharide export system ATP-binding protein